MVPPSTIKFLKRAAVICYISENTNQALVFYLFVLVLVGYFHFSEEGGGVSLSLRMASKGGEFYLRVSDENGH